MLRMSDADLSDYTERQRPMTESRQEPAAKPKRKAAFKLTRPEPSEAAVLNMILRALKVHPKVVWHTRMNSAAGRLLYPNGTTSQWMQFAFKGCPDIIAGLSNGKTAFIEVKKPSGRVLVDQASFLDKCKKNGIPSGVARSVSDALAIIES